MSQVSISGNASGTGVFTIQSPNSNSNYTLTLPTATTTVVGTDATQAFTNKSFDSASVPTVSGTAPLYFCRAWVNFNGTGVVAIRASGNVSSITDNGTGDYTVNFTTAMPDANYAWAGSAKSTTTNGWVNGSTATDQASGSLRISCVTVGPAAFDPSFVNVSIFR